MATIAERLAAAINDIDAQIHFIQTEADAKIAALRTKRGSLVSAGRLLTPEIEQTVEGLHKLGLTI